MKKLLNIDGGGIKVYLSLLILKYIENKTGKNIKDIFDFYAGVSASSIILSGILTNYSLDDLIKRLKNINNNMFYRSYYYSIISLFGLINSKYPEYHINTELKSIFKDLKIKDMDKPYIILCYDLNTSKPIHYSSYNKTLNNELLWKIIRSSTAAPIFFPPFQINEKLLIDGGIITNDLSELIYSHALNYYDNENYIQVSIGTGFYSPKINSKPSGLLSWTGPIFENIFNAHSIYELNTMKQLCKLDNIKHFFRIDILLEQYIQLDDYNAFSKMDIIFEKWLNENTTYLDNICDVLLNN